MRTCVRWNRHTLALLAIVGGMWYAAEAQSNGAAHLVALLVAAMGLMSWLHARANLRGLRARLLGARPVAQDESKRISVELRASGAFSPCGLEVMVVGAEKTVFVERVSAGGVVNLDLPPPVRPAGGALRVLMRSVYPLGLFTAQAVMETSWVRRVHPKAAGDLPLPEPLLTGDVAAVATARTRAGGDDFAGLREWRAGDSPRHIDWRSAARGGPLMVKSWSSGASGAVVLDWNALKLADADRSAQVARWIEVCEEEGWPYELRLPERTIRASLGPVHRRCCLDALAMQMCAEAGAAASGELKSSGAGGGMSFEHSFQLPWRPLLFLSLALLLAVWPMQGYIATAGLVVYAACLLWRGVLRMGVPHVLARVSVVVAGVVGVWWEHDGLRGMEPGIALLLVLAGAKVLESRTPREFQVLALIGWFLAFCVVLLENHLSRSAWVIAVFLLITACMVRFRRSAPGVCEPARVTLTLFAQALPLVLVLFFVFPRGLLNLGDALGRGRFGGPGIDNTLDPGSIAGVALSSEVVFRARFPDGGPPANASRYWRCITLWDCDGLRWTRGQRLGYLPALAVRDGPDDVRQVIDLEPHGRMWLPALDLPVRALMRGGRMLPEFDQTLASPVPVRGAERLEVISRVEDHTRSRPPPRPLPRHHREAALQLPEVIPPRLRQITDAWEASAQNDEQIVNLALNHLRTQGFTYTLEPGQYAGPGGLEDFFLNRRTGFCEHFSAGFATLMRMAGVPSRLVVGYLGGEYSDHNGGYLIVKQSDVHAWVEVWLERYGWFRIDPTAALAPDRVNIDLRAWLAGGAEAAERQRRSLWWRVAQRTRLLWDSLSYAWQDRVIDYNQETQRGLLARMGFVRGRLVLLLSSATAILAVSLLVSWWLRRPARYPDPWMRAWQRTCRRLAGAGVRARLANEGPLAYAGHVSQARPDLAAQFKPLAEMYAAGRYGGACCLLGEFKRRTSCFKPARRPGFTRS